MYTRRTAWLFVFAILAMACKEEIPLVVACLGLWSMLLQRRWRSGLLLLLLALTWTSLALLVIHLNSPTGQPLLAARYAYLGNSPLQIAHTFLAPPASILKQHLLDRAHRTYLASLLAPAGYLPLLAPWILILALPTLALNLLSSNPGMYSGLFQYNAEIVPILIFSTIETITLILWLIQQSLVYIRREHDDHIVHCRGDGLSSPCLCSPTPDHIVHSRSNPLWSPCLLTLCSRFRKHSRGDGLSSPCRAACSYRINPFHRYLHSMLLALMLIYILFSVLHQDYTHSAMLFAQDFRWPHITAHTQLAQRFIDMIPPAASVSAQSRLVPHLSQRLNVYMFPYADDRANYILLDVTGDRYPYFNPQAYTREVKKVLQSGNYGILAAENGYLLLERGLPPPAVLPYPLSS